jgi:hypothetical protein
MIREREGRQQQESDEGECKSKVGVAYFFMHCWKVTVALLVLATRSTVVEYSTCCNVINGCGITTGENTKT